MYVGTNPPTSLIKKISRKRSIRRKRKDKPGSTTVHFPNQETILSSRSVDASGIRVKEVISSKDSENNIREFIGHTNSACLSNVMEKDKCLSSDQNNGFLRTSILSTSGEKKDMDTGVDVTLQLNADPTNTTGSFSHQMRREISKDTQQSMSILVEDKVQKNSLEKDQIHKQRAQLDHQEEPLSPIYIPKSTNTNQSDFNKPVNDSIYSK